MASFRRKVGIGLALWSLVLTAHAQDRLYVNAAASSGGDGDSWATAYNDLQLALSDGRLSSGDQIWVAAGTYYPSVEYCVETCASTSRNKTFRLMNGVRIYGGFIGVSTETLLAQRNPELNETILSGNINQPNLSSDNCYHVVTAHNVGSGTMLNGFTITAGNASDSTVSNGGVGGGLLVAFGESGASSPQIVRCKFVGNSATGLASDSGSGGAVFVEWQGTESGPPAQFVNCSFIDNVASHAGGATYINGGRAVFTNCVFLVNSVLDPAGSGGGLAANCALTVNDTCDGPLATVNNCTFYANDAFYGSSVAAQTNSGPTFLIRNSILWSSDPNGDASPHVTSAVTATYSDIQGTFTWPGTGNINADPLFCDEGAGILRLSDSSPCIDAGLDANVPLDITDVDDDGNPNGTPTLPWDRIRSARQYDAIAGGQLVDMGAYENAHSGDCPWDLDHSGVGDLGDIAIATACYGTSCEPAASPGTNISCCVADFDCDGLIDLDDIAVVTAGYGETCGESLRGGGNSSSSETNCGSIDEAWVEWAREAPQEDLQAWLENCGG